MSEVDEIDACVRPLAAKAVASEVKKPRLPGFGRRG
jgi:hypothetical protein